MDDVEIVSIHVGKPRPILYQNKEICTGLFKFPVKGPLFLSWEHFDGDGQADLLHHGGREKAVCVYSYEHYPFWERLLQRELPCGAFGENITVRGLPETDVCIGDTFRLGDAVVQISQPRQPCYKLSAVYGRPDMPLIVQETGYTGFYFRVLKEGIVSPSDGLIKIASHPKAVTVAFANKAMHREKDNTDAIRALLEVEELSVNWRRTFQKRLEGGDVDTQERLTGSPNRTQ